MSFTEKEYLSLNSQGFHKVVYNDWGPKDGPVIVGVHGLTCNGHDFDDLAEALVAQGYRFIAVDLPGRSRSDNLPNPLDYNLFQYMRDISALFAHLDITAPGSIDFLGVSLGGMIGTVLASIENSPIKRLILNDVGPVVPLEMLEYISKHILYPRRFETIKELEKDLRRMQRVQWGPMSDDQWHHMAEHNARATDDGGITYNFDPNLIVAFNKAIDEGGGDLWACWDQITCPVLLIWGAKSFILTEDIVREMEGRGPGENMDLVIFEDCGHVPSLVAPAHIQAIEEWLANT